MDSRRRHGRIFVAAVAAALALVAPAQAAQPRSEAITDAGTDVVSCDGFDAVLQRSFDGRVTVFFDGEGNPVRLQVLVNVSGSLTNTTTGLSLPVRGHVHFVFDFAAGTDTFVGPVFIVTRVGEGAVVKDVGRIVFSGDGLVFEAGPHDAIASGGQALCDAVA
ncbi:MAG TPA: hypothetical protein VNJ53_08325 [Gaiellaceae bacterium]|nr:hypothetical protein [Gaiellaceae bacterium]